MWIKKRYAYCLLILKEMEILSPKPLAMEDLVNFDEIDRSSSNTSPFSASKEELRRVTHGDGEKRIPIGVFRKSRRKQQRTLTQDLSSAIRVGRSADSVTLVRYAGFDQDSVLEPCLSPVASPAVVLTPIFTFRDLLSPTAANNRFELPELNLPGPVVKI
jgi:hypothetical protein